MCDETTRATGMPNGNSAPWSPLVTNTSPLVSGVLEATRSALSGLPGPVPLTTASEPGAGP